MTNTATSSRVASINKTGSTPLIGKVTLTGGTNVTLTQSGQDISIAATGGVLWNEVTGISQTAAVNNGYILNNAGLVTLTLPSTASVGDVVEVAGKGAGGWKVGQNSGQLIHFGSTTTTTGTGGSLASVNQWDNLRLLCVTANTTWTVLSSQGNITVT